MGRLLITAVMFCGGCAGSPSTTTSPTDAMSGTWSGKWFDETHKHEGPMTCHLREIEPTQYEARFSGFFMAIIPFWYTVEMKVEPGDDAWRVQAESHIKWLGGSGRYECDGTIQNDIMECRFRAVGSEGYFRLQRQTSSVNVEQDDATAHDATASCDRLAQCVRPRVRQL